MRYVRSYKDFLPRVDFFFDQIYKPLYKFSDSDFTVFVSIEPGSPNVEDMFQNSHKVKVAIGVINLMTNSVKDSIEEELIEFFSVN